MEEPGDVVCQRQRTTNDEMLGPEATMLGQDLTRSWHPVEQATSESQVPLFLDWPSSGSQAVGRSQEPGRAARGGRPISGLKHPGHSDARLFISFLPSLRKFFQAHRATAANRWADDKYSLCSGDVVCCAQQRAAETVSKTSSADTTRQGKMGCSPSIRLRSGDPPRRVQTQTGFLWLPRSRQVLSCKSYAMPGPSIVVIGPCAGTTHFCKSHRG